MVLISSINGDLCSTGLAEGLKFCACMDEEKGMASPEKVFLCAVQANMDGER